MVVDGSICLMIVVQCINLEQTWSVIVSPLAIAPLFLPCVCCVVSNSQDRILFCSHAGPATIAGCGYDSCRTLRCSDHRYLRAFAVDKSPSARLEKCLSGRLSLQTCLCRFQSEVGA